MKRVIPLVLLLMAVVLVSSTPLAEAKKKGHRHKGHHHHKRHSPLAPIPPPDQSVNGIGQFKGDCFWADTSYADPIVKPTPEMQHLHNFFGNKGVTNDSTLEQLMTHESTCDRPANKSAYWVPQVYIGGVKLEPRRTGVYYSSKGGLDPVKTENTPLGIKVIAKDPYLAPTVQEAAEIDWYCPSGNSPNNIPDGISQQPPATEACSGTSNPNRTLGVTVHFPECLDPATLGDYQQRLIQAPGRTTQPLAEGYRSCPAGYKQIPTLQLFVDYKIPTSANYSGPNSLEIASMNGTLVPWNYMHADYFNAEDLSSLVSFCINGKHAGQPACVNQRE